MHVVWYNFYWFSLWQPNVCNGNHKVHLVLSYVGKRGNSLTLLCSLQVRKWTLLKTRNSWGWILPPVPPPLALPPPFLLLHIIISTQARTLLSTANPSRDHGLTLPLLSPPVFTSPEFCWRREQGVDISSLLLQVNQSLPHKVMLSLYSYKQSPHYSYTWTIPTATTCLTC